MSLFVPRATHDLPQNVICFVTNRTVQTSKYATFKVDDQRSKTIEVTPVDEWWQFKKAPRDDGKLMSVKEAEELMKKQENFMGPLSLANKVLGKNSLVREFCFGYFFVCFLC